MVESVGKTLRRVDKRLKQIEKDILEIKKENLETRNESTFQAGSFILFSIAITFFIAWFTSQGLWILFILGFIVYIIGLAFNNKKVQQYIIRRKIKI